MGAILLGKNAVRDRAVLYRQREAEGFQTPWSNGRETGAETNVRESWRCGHLHDVAAVAGLGWEGELVDEDLESVCRYSIPSLTSGTSTSVAERVGSMMNRDIVIVGSGKFGLEGLRGGVSLLLVVCEVLNSRMESHLKI